MTDACLSIRIKVKFNVPTFGGGIMMGVNIAGFLTQKCQVRIIPRVVGMGAMRLVGWVDTCGARRGAPPTVATRVGEPRNGKRAC